MRSGPFAIAIAAATLCAATLGAAPPSEAAIDRMIDAMPLEERIGQLMFVGFDGNAASEELRRLVGEWRVGGVILYSRNIGSPAQLRDLATEIARLSESGTRPFLAIDQEGGEVTRMRDGVPLLPGNMALGATRSAALAYEAGRSIGFALREHGIEMNFAPVLDRADAMAPISSRSFGHDPRLVSDLGTAYIRGLHEAGVAAVAKHYPGLGSAQSDTHKALPRLEAAKGDLRWDLEPFRAAVLAGVDAIMLAHAVAPPLSGEDPVMVSPRALDHLRNELGFDGLVLTDALEMDAVDRRKGIGRVAVRAIEAGADMLLVLLPDRDRAVVRDALRKAVHSGEISEARLRESLRRIVRLKLHRRAAEPLQKCDVAREIAERSVTLLRNRGGVLPLAQDPSSRLYIGPGGLIAKAAEASRTLHPPTHPTRADVRRWAAAAAREAARATVIIGVAQNRAQVEVLRAARDANRGATFVFVSLGSPQLVLALPDVAAYVCAYGYLAPSQEAVARLLKGELTPSGRLPVDVPPLFRADEGLGAFR